MVWPHGAQFALLANDGGFRAASRRELTAEVPWQLDSPGPERLPKTIYVRFGNSNQTFQDDIILDQTPPRLLSVSHPRGASAASAPTAHTSAKSRRLLVRAQDSTSDIREVEIAGASRRKIKTVPYRRDRLVACPSAGRFLRVVDKAGNHSTWKRVPR